VAAWPVKVPGGSLGTILLLKSFFASSLCQSLSTSVENENPSHMLHVHFKAAALA